MLVDNRVHADGASSSYTDEKVDEIMQVRYHDPPPELVSLPRHALCVVRGILPSRFNISMLCRRARSFSRPTSWNR